MTHEPSPRILICKLTAIGDVIHGIPVACALRDHFPNALIAWVAEGRAGDLLRSHAAIDELIQVPRRWLKSAGEVRALRRRLREQRFDITLDLQGLTKSAIAARLSGARRRIGFAGKMGREFSRVLNNERIEVRSDHVVDRYLELLRPLGIEAPEVRFDVPRHADDTVAVVEFLDQHELFSRPAIINPGAGWPSKRWSNERFAAVAKHLGDTYGVMSIVVWAGDEEHQWAKEIVASSGGHAVLAPRTSLTELAELCRMARLFVGSDTGPMHLAAAVGTPCVGLFGPMPAERNGPYGEGHIALQRARLEGTSREKRTADNATMLAITIDDVCVACDQIFSHQGEGREQRVA